MNDVNIRFTPAPTTPGASPAPDAKTLPGLAMTGSTTSDLRLQVRDEKTGAVIGTERIREASGLWDGICEKGGAFHNTEEDVARVADMGKGYTASRIRPMQRALERLEGLSAGELRTFEPDLKEIAGRLLKEHAFERKDVPEVERLLGKEALGDAELARLLSLTEATLALRADRPPEALLEQKAALLRAGFVNTADIPSPMRLPLFDSGYTGPSRASQTSGKGGPAGDGVSALALALDTARRSEDYDDRRERGLDEAELIIAAGAERARREAKAREEEAQEESRWKEYREEFLGAEADVTAMNSVTDGESPVARAGDHTPQRWRSDASPFASLQNEADVDAAVSDRRHVRSHNRGVAEKRRTAGRDAETESEKAEREKEKRYSEGEEKSSDRDTRGRVR